MVTTKKYSDVFVTAVQSRNRGTTALRQKITDGTGSVSNKKRRHPTFLVILALQVYSKSLPRERVMEKRLTYSWSPLKVTYSPWLVIKIHLLKISKDTFPNHPKTKHPNISIHCFCQEVCQKSDSWCLPTLPDAPMLPAPALDPLTVSQIETPQVWDDLSAYEGKQKNMTKITKSKIQKTIPSDHFVLGNDPKHAQNMISRLKTECIKHVDVDGGHDAFLGVEDFVIMYNTNLKMTLACKKDNDPLNLNWYQFGHVKVKGWSSWA